MVRITKQGADIQDDDITDDDTKDDDTKDDDTKEDDTKEDGIHVHVSNPLTYLHYYTVNIIYKKNKRILSINSGFSQQILIW